MVKSRESTEEGCELIENKKACITAGFKALQAGLEPATP